jgi:hypothetical protein
MGTLSHSNLPCISRKTFPHSQSCIEHGKYNCSPDQMHSTTRRGVGEEWNWKVRNALITIQTKQYTTKYFQTLVHTCAGQDVIIKNTANPPVLSEFIIRHTGMKLGRSRSTKRGTTAVALCEGSNNNVTLGHSVSSRSLCRRIAIYVLPITYQKGANFTHIFI